MPHLPKVVTLCTVSLLPFVLAVPSILECANDTGTRLQVGKTIMAGPAKACSEQCAVKLEVSATTNGQTQILVTTNSPGIGFVVRVNDGAGILSSKHVNLTSQCDGQMYSKGQSGVPAGAYVLTLTRSNSSAAAKDLVVTVGFANRYSPIPTVFPGVVLVRDPPLAPTVLYRCFAFYENKCQTSPTGVDNATCHERCTSPPAPTSCDDDAVCPADQPKCIAVPGPLKPLRGMLLRALPRFLKDILSRIPGLKKLVKGECATRIAKVFWPGHDHRFDSVDRVTSLV